MRTFIDKCKSVMLRESAFISIGNIHGRCALFRKRFGLTNQVANYNFCIVDHMGSINRFASCIQGLIRESYEECASKAFYNDTTIAFDSSGINYKSYEFDPGVSREAVLEWIKNNLAGRTVLHYEFNEDNKINLLTHRSNTLLRITEGLKFVDCKVSRFISAKYVQAKSLIRKYGLPGLNMVLQIGYRSSNICLFQDSLLTFYQTIDVGLEETITFFKDRTGFSFDKAEELISETVVTGYIEHMSQKIPDMIAFYLSSLVRTIFASISLPRPVQLIVLGIRTPGFANVLRKFASTITIVTAETDIALELYKNT